MEQSPLISSTEAIQWHKQSGVRFVDATWYLPNMPINTYEVFCDEHIPGAVHFDIDHVSDQSSDLPHMFPSAERFAKCVGEMGLSDSDRLVVYDRGKYVASARVWWMFLSFGHVNVKVLDGGLDAWKKQGGSLEDGVPEPKPVDYKAKFDADAVISWNEMQSIFPDPSTAVLDARSPGRFHGKDPEPRPGLRGGHIPNSKNVYYADLMDADGIMKGADEVRKILEPSLVNSDAPIVTTCGSGVTAAILLLAFYQFRQHDMRLYDGSWTEWALNPDSPL